MAKKKVKQVVAVKKPKIGERYVFTFAGGKLVGRLDCRNEKLEAHYGEPWFTFVVERGESGHERATRYPVSIYSIVRVATDKDKFFD